MRFQPAWPRQHSMGFITMSMFDGYMELVQASETCWSLCKSALFCIVARRVRAEKITEQCHRHHLYHHYHYYLIIVYYTIVYIYAYVYVFAHITKTGS